MSLLHPLELMIVGVIAIALLRFQLPTVHQRTRLKFNTLLANGDLTEDLLKLVAFLIASAAATVALWTAN